MKKILILLVLVLVCSSIFATEGRVNGLGVNPIFYEDDYLLTLFPQYLGMYMNMAYIDAASMSNYSGGMNFQLMGNDFGLYINKDFPDYFDYYHAKLEKAMNMYMSLAGLDLGMVLAIDKYNNDEYSGDNSLEESTLGLGGKLGMDLMGFDMAGHVYFASGKSDYENSNETKNSSFIVKGVMRRRMFETENSVVYPAATLNFRTEKETMSCPSKTLEEEETSYNYFSIMPGIGINHWLTDHVMMIGAISAGLSTSKYESDTTYTADTTYTYTAEDSYTMLTLPKLELGLEAYITKWLTMRAGINKTYYSWSEEEEGMSSNTIKYSQYSSSFYKSFGIGIIFDRFVVDWEIYEDLYWLAPYIISGNTSEFSSSFTIKYMFGKE